MVGPPSLSRTSTSGSTTGLRSRAQRWEGRAYATGAPDSQRRQIGRSQDNANRYFAFAVATSASPDRGPREGQLIRRPGQRIAPKSAEQEEPSGQSPAGAGGYASSPPFDTSKWEPSQRSDQGTRPGRVLFPGRAPSAVGRHSMEVRNPRAIRGHGADILRVARRTPVLGHTVGRRGRPGPVPSRSGTVRPWEALRPVQAGTASVPGSRWRTNASKARGAARDRASR